MEGVISNSHSYSDFVILVPIEEALGKENKMKNEKRKMENLLTTGY